MSEYFGYQTYENQSLPQYPFNTYADYNLNEPWLSYSSTPEVEVVAYYPNLLVQQYIVQPKAYATIQALITPVVMGMLPLAVQNAFQIGTAVGVQLDILGKYVGVTRNGFGPTGPITLSDADFTTFIQLGIVNNQATSSLASIQALLHTYFDNEIFVFDYLNMRMSYYLNSTSTDLDLATLFVTEGLLPKPLGVQLSSVIYAPITTLESFFGLRTYEHAGFNISPLNSYSSYNTNYPFLSYTYRLEV